MVHKGGKNTEASHEKKGQIWRKHKLERTWIAFKVARTRYKNYLRDAKLSVVSEKVSECGPDTWKLYSLVNSLTDSTNVNPFPDHQGSDEELAEQFSEFFMERSRK